MSLSSNSSRLLATDIEITHVVSQYDKRPSGINTALDAMISGVRRVDAGISIQVCSTTTGATVSLPQSGVPILWAQSSSKPLLKYWDHAAKLQSIINATLEHGTALRTFFHERRDQRVVIHTHGLWLYSQFAAWRVARGFGLPMVMSLQGMLEPVRLRISPWRKRLIWLAYARRMVNQAACVIAASELEADSIRSMGAKAPIRIVPLAFGSEEADGRQAAVSNAIHPNQESVLLYLSRITPVKGLDLLVEAVGRLNLSGCKIRILGSEEQGFGEQLRRRIAELNLNHLFEFLGPVFGKEKWEAIASADVLVLPTLSENFGLIVTEALSMGKPVLTTTGAPWRDLADYRCGWQVAPTVEGIANGLREVLATDDEELQLMGQRGQQLFQQKYTLEAAGRALYEVYREVQDAFPGRIE